MIFFLLLVSIGGFGGQDVQNADVAAARKAAIAAMNFRQGDAVGLNRARSDFTDSGWMAFMKKMQGFLDGKGAPTFTSSFLPVREARVLDEKDGVIHLRIPGTLTQSSQLGKTTYQRFAIEVYASRDATEGRIKIHRLEQITCLGASTACN